MDSTFQLTIADVNECDTQEDNCDEHADCTNTDGSYSCTCRPGFSGDGLTCEGTIKTTNGTG